MGLLEYWLFVSKQAAESSWSVVIGQPLWVVVTFILIQSLLDWKSLRGICGEGLRGIMSKLRPFLSSWKDHIGKAALAAILTFVVVFMVNLIQIPHEREMALRGQIQEEVQSLKQRALRLANRIKMFADEQSVAYNSKELNFYPHDQQLKQKKDKERGEFDASTSKAFTKSFDAELEGIIPDFQNSGTNVAVLGKLRRAIKGDERDPINYPGPVTTIYEIAAELKDLAGQIDESGNLVH